MGAPGRVVALVGHPRAERGDPPAVDRHIPDEGTDSSPTLNFMPQTVFARMNPIAPTTHSSTTTDPIPKVPLGRVCSKKHLASV